MLSNEELSTTPLSESGDLNVALGACPVPNNNYAEVTLAHGSGGKVSHRLIERTILPAFQNPLLAGMHDGAMFQIGNARLAFSTDSYVIDPIFFPGGDVGELAVNGTVNDLAMCGATPLYLSAALIIEEGFPMAHLERILHSMRQAADAAEVTLVTGDTKVVPRGKCDKIFINTSGIGEIAEGISISAASAKIGDKIILSGRIADHGIAIMSVREGLEFESEIKSDTAPLNGLVKRMLSAAPSRIHVLRDATRGGISSVLIEIAESSNIGVEIVESAIPIREDVRGACEILGLDPLYVANEGKLVAFVAPEAAERVLAAMNAHQYGTEAAIIGEVVESHPKFVTMKTRIGGTRIVDMLSGEQLPRIC